ncbi:MAG: hypothetical protein IJV16_08075 [Lachnospiraceae bacterium]|nr:hypothetical protein [Lachnospiraceae bacterium]
MTLLITVFAAVIATYHWYIRKDDTLNIGMLCFMFWGASIMWFVDAVFEYAELGAEYFTPATGDMVTDAFLGLSVVAFALVIWIAALLIKDPRGVVAKTLHKQTHR